MSSTATATLELETADPINPIAALIAHLHLQSVALSFATSVDRLLGHLGQERALLALEAATDMVRRDGRNPGDQVDPGVLPLESIVRDADGDDWKLRGDGWLLRIAGNKDFGDYATTLDSLTGQCAGEDTYGPFTLVQYGPAAE